MWRHRSIRKSWRSLISLARDPVGEGLRGAGWRSGTKVEILVGEGVGRTWREARGDPTCANRFEDFCRFLNSWEWSVLYSFVGGRGRRCGATVEVVSVEMGRTWLRVMGDVIGETLALQCVSIGWEGAEWTEWTGCQVGDEEITCTSSVSMSMLWIWTLA